MKKIILPALAILLIVSGFTVVSKEPKDEQKKIAMFLTEMQDESLMATKTAVLATEKTTSESVREVALLIISDEASIQTRIEEQAKAKGISLSMILSSEKAKVLENLKLLEGKNFDRQYKKVSKKGYKKTIRMLKKAINFRNREISNFAKNNLVFIEGHLKKIEAMK